MADLHLLNNRLRLRRPCGGDHLAQGLLSGRVGLVDDGGSVRRGGRWQDDLVAEYGSSRLVLRRLERVRLLLRVGGEDGRLRDPCGGRLGDQGGGIGGRVL